MKNREYIFFRGIVFCLVAIFSFQSCKKKEYLFEQVTSSVTRINFSNNLRKDPNLNIFNYLYFYNGAGVAAGDYNGDGFIDLYFVSNQEADILYLNKGDFKFEDVTTGTGYVNDTGWTTGVSNVDINGDGLLDIYISKVSDFLNLKGHNLLLVNQGNSPEGIPQFREESAKYGLDFSGFSTQAVFLDYDLDGDLDMYLLNHSVHPNRTYGRGSKRKDSDPKAGDRLFRNDQGKYVDVSAEAGIFQGEIGYGLGIGVADLNDNGYPDMYIGNDFFENDYLYENQQDGSFRDVISEQPRKLGHTSHFSMGNDVADINNDGLPDIISLDMLPQDLVTYKTSGLEYPFQNYATFLKNGFSPQYMQNTLHINLGDLNFSETAFLSGVAATEWSWGALFADFDNDGNKDLVISNGIKGATNDMDFIRYISNDKIQERLSRGEMADFNELIDVLPEKKVPNYIFQNLGDNTFQDRREDWINFEPTFSHGVIYADLDNDGDLDIVVNNMETRAGIFRNLSEKKRSENNFLKVKLKGDEKNSLGIGAKVKIFYGGGMQVQEHYLSRGYLSSLSPGLHFGLAGIKEIDSVQVIWRKGISETKSNVALNTVLNFDLKEAREFKSGDSNAREINFQKVNFLLEHYHVEQGTLDFNRDLLIPFAYSNLGPGVSVGDINGDGLEDLIFGGGKTQPLAIYMQQEGGNFSKTFSEDFEKNAVSEDIQQVLIDVDGDDDLDLIVVSGGNEFQTGIPLQPKLYINEKGTFRWDEEQFSGVYLNASGVSSVDLNKDGFPDINFTSNVVPGHYGATPAQYLFLNDGKGNFKEVTESYSREFREAGNVQDVAWVDINNDGYKDAIVVGHWMPVKIFLNNGKNLQLLEANLGNTNGWWNVIEAADFDGDGDIDFVIGNWGLNTRLKASKEKPLKLYLNDFDDNGSNDPVITYYYDDVETAFASKDELDQQMPFLKKKFPTYKKYANANFSEILPRDKMKNAEIKEVFELASCYFENLGNNRFKKHVLPFEAQVSSVHAIKEYDFNRDGFQDLLLLGNNYEVSTQLGRLDASHGVILINDRNGNFQVYQGPSPGVSGPVRDIEEVQINGESYFVITVNGAEPIFLKITYN